MSTARRAVDWARFGYFLPGPVAGESPVSPDLRTVGISSDGGPVRGGASAAAAGKTSVVADEENNALLISTTAREFERIERILRQLDVLPIQVLLEAVIAEVTVEEQGLDTCWYSPR